MAHDSFSHVSLPNSPGRGIVLNVQSTLPLFTSKARTRPLVLLWVLTVMPSLNDEPTMTTSLTTVGVEWRPISPVSRSICCPFPNTAPFFMSTTPPSPKDGSIAPCRALSLIGRRILRAPDVRRLVRPVAVSGARHRAALGRRADGHPDHACSEHGHDRHGAFHCVEHVVS